VVKLVDPYQDTVLWERPVENGAKGCVLGQEALGIFEVDGKFALIRLPDGKVLFDAKTGGKLDGENSLISIHLLRSADGYVLVTNGAPSAIQQNESYQPAPGGLNNLLINGRVYGFDQTQGKKLWGPVRINQHGLVLSQPSQLPILTFARHIQHSMAQNGQPDARTSLMCIDKRSGRIVFNDDRVLGSNISNFEQLGDRADETVSIMLPNKTVTLKFTNKEVPPDPKEPDANKAKAGSHAVKNAMEALGKALEGALKSGKPKENDDD
jgi:hypothetical protein